MNKDNSFYRKLKIIYMILSLVLIFTSTFGLSFINTNAQEPITINCPITDEGGDPIPNTASVIQVISSSDNYSATVCEGYLKITALAGTYIDVRLQITTNSGYIPVCAVTNDEDLGYNISIEDLYCSTGSSSLQALVFFHCLETGEPSKETGNIIQVYGEVNSSSGCTIYVSGGAGYLTEKFQSDKEFTIEKNAEYNLYKNKLNNNVSEGSVVVDETLAGFYNGSIRELESFSEAEGNNNFEEKMAFAVREFHKLIDIITNTLLAFAVITSVISCSINIFKLSTMPSHPIQRRRTILEIGSCFICVAILGSIRLVTNIIITTIL